MILWAKDIVYLCHTKSDTALHMVYSIIVLEEGGGGCVEGSWRSLEIDRLLAEEYISFIFWHHFSLLYPWFFRFAFRFLLVLL